MKIKRSVFVIVLSFMIAFMYVVGGGSVSSKSFAADGDTEGTSEATQQQTTLEDSDIIVLDKDELTISKGISETVKATVLDSKGATKENQAELLSTYATWSSSDEKVATVTDGKVTGTGAGSATVTVTLKNGSKYDCEVKVSDPTNVSNESTSGSTESGDSQTYPITKKLPGYEDVSYTITKVEKTQINADYFYTFYIEITIGKDASGDQLIDLANTVITAANQKLFAPGCAIQANITIKTADGNKHTYAYKDGSLTATTSNWSDTNKEMMTDIKDSAGNALPINALNAVGANAAIQLLYGKTDLQITPEDLVNIYKTLASPNNAGVTFTGENALTNYYIWFINNYAFDSKTNNWKKLSTPNEYKSIAEIMSKDPMTMIRINDNIRNDQYDVPVSVLNKWADDESLSAMMKYVMVTKSYTQNGVEYYEIQFKGPEQDIATSNYESWYKDLFLVNYGQTKDSDGNAVNANDSNLNLNAFASYISQNNGTDYGILDYSANSDAYKAANAYFKTLLAKGLSEKDATASAINIFLGLNGPLIGNQYQCYDFTYNNTITLQQVDGELTVDKTDESGNKITSSETGFNLYYITKENDSDVTYYYTKDGTWTTDKSSAAVMMTTNGSLNVKYLLPNTYYIKEVLAPNGYEVSNDALSAAVNSGEVTTVKFADTATPTPTPTPTPTTGSIKVTKNTFLDSKSKAMDQTFYAAVFDESGNKASDVKSISMNDSATASVTFDNLTLGKTYTVKETDANGNVITDPSTQKIDGWAKIIYDNNTVKLTSDNTTGSAVINNYFESTHPAYGTVKVTKLVKVAGKAKGTNNTYYTALFSDSACSDRVTDVKALSMNGKSSASVTFTKDKDGNNLKSNTAYYIAETDSQGNAITNGKDKLGCTISISSKEVKITASNMSPSSTITNSYSDSVHPYNPPKHHNTPVTPASSTTTKTGDDFDMGMWIMIAAIGAGAALTSLMLRRRAKKDK